MIIGYSDAKMAHLATIAPFGFPDFNPPTHFQAYRRLGCRSLQFYRNEQNPPRPEDALRIARNAGMPFDSIHGLFGRAYDPSCPDEAVRKSAVETYIREGELAVRLGGPVVVVHPGPPALNTNDITPATITARVDPLRRTMDDLAAIGDRLGVTYLFENIPPNYHFGSDPGQLAALVRAVDHPRIRMCFDTGHAHLTSGAIAALDACADVIEYVHVNDNAGDIDSHLIPGDGTIPWDEVSTRLAAMRHDLPVMLELFQPESEIRARCDAGLAAELSRWLAIR